MPKPASLLAALTPVEFRDFLPEPLLGNVQSIAERYHSCDSRELDRASLERLLNDVKPEILLAAWKTPLLPARLPPSLRYVCYLCGSVKKLITREHLENGLLVTNWGGSISPVVAEWALFHVLSGLRKATEWTFVMHLEGGWKDGDTETASLFGRKIGLHGFGAVAREFIKLVKPFGPKISVFAPDLDARTAPEFGVSPSPSLEALFSENDIIVEAAPLIPSTTGIITEKLLRSIRPGSVFVNVGRGAVVDEAALLRVAREGKIQICLDVFTDEPLPKDSGFRGLRNVTLTPHISGPTTDRRRDAGAFAVANLHAYAAGAPLSAVVSTAVYDRSS